jgi:hypothetical protein
MHYLWIWFLSLHEILRLDIEKHVKKSSDFHLPVTETPGGKNILYLKGRNYDGLNYLHYYSNLKTGLLVLPDSWKRRQEYSLREKKQYFQSSIMLKLNKEWVSQKLFKNATVSSCLCWMHQRVCALNIDTNKNMLPLK